MLKLLTMATPGLLLLAGVLYLNNSEVRPSGSSETTDKVVIAKSTATEPPLLQVAIAPDLKSTGHGFELLSGIKDVLDSLIFSSETTEKLAILVFSKSYCEQQGLSNKGCSTFLDLMARYIDYKLELKLVEAKKLNISDHIAAIEYQFETLRDAQAHFFSPVESEALFGDDWIMDQQALVRKSIALNKTLSKQERTQLIAQQINALPDTEKAALKPTLMMSRLDELKASHADKQLVLLDVETELGFEAAQRLKQTWQKQDDFQRRIEKISPQYHAMGATQSSEKERTTQQEQLLTQHFNGNEIRRAKAILHYQQGNS